MKLYPLNLLTLLTIYSSLIYIVSAVEVEYTKDGVTRKDGKCNINFVNFGIEDSITQITVSFKENTLIIEKLKNGNEGLNNGMKFTQEELNKYIEIYQDGENITDFTIPSYSNGLFSIQIKNLDSCEGITVKQTYKEDVSMYTYLLYENVVPKPINTNFASERFGPSSNNIPYSIIHWDMNHGLDELREKCGIYIKYNGRSSGGGWHYVWYLSTENINTKNCSNTEFYNIAKKHYVDYDIMEEIFGDHYEGYVIKRETGAEGHMDGIVTNNKYIVEMYQQECGNQSGYQVICTMSSLEKLTFDQFTNELINNCLSIIIDKTEVPTYEVDSSGITLKFKSYSLKVVNNGKGSLPTSTSGSVSYKEFSGATSSGVARFSASLSCYDGSYKDDKCRCQACPVNCSLCKDANTCTSCKDNLSSTLENGQCKCNPGYFADENGLCTKCKDGCKTCDINGCLTCAKENTELDGKGGCKCKKGFFADEKGVCTKCKDDCETCDINGCLTCAKENTELDGKGGCKCKKGFFADEKGVCTKCKDGCETCDINGCLTCAGENTELDGKGGCKCKKGFFADEKGVCTKCKDGCETCDINGCLTCAGENTELDGEGGCKCKKGFFANEKGVCTKCKDGCETCDINGCLTCAGENTELDGEGGCKCKKGFFADEKGVCTKCMDGCETCDINGCLTCSGENTELDGEGGCKCKKGFFADEKGVCTKCMDGCETCDINGCLTCAKENTELDGKGGCKCKKGFYENNKNECVACMEGCSECIVGDKCTKCADKDRVPDEDGICVCKQSTYEDITTHTCKACDAQCATCNNAGSCTTCKDKRATISDGVCNCNDSYMDTEGLCYVCDASCKKCSKKGCTVCQDPTKTPDENGKC
eukprot:jgi/Orpsp1_1/1178468/evm.model.c7180000065435.1